MVVAFLAVSMEVRAGGVEEKGVELNYAVQRLFCFVSHVKRMTE